MVGLILNVEDDRLAPDSPMRTREEDRQQPPVFLLEDGYPVFEVWYWHADLGRWFVMTRTYRPELVEHGAVLFFGIEQLKAWIAYLYAERGDA